MDFVRESALRALVSLTMAVIHSYECTVKLLSYLIVLFAAKNYFLDPVVGAMETLDHGQLQYLLTFFIINLGDLQLRAASLHPHVLGEGRGQVTTC
jgi:hypothetical protein